MHPNQLTISVATVRKLVDAQFPEWRGLPVWQFASQGTVNALFRIGERLVARFPLEPGGVGSARRRPAVPRPLDGDLLPAQRAAPGRSPALDLVGAWHLLEAGPRRVLRDDLDCGDLEWERGKAWAFEQAMGAAWYYVESNPAMSLMGQRTLQRITADTPVRA